MLSGINLGCYRDREAGCDLAGLLIELARVEGIDRIRLSSIEVNHLTEELVEAMHASPTVAPHLHVPLQSGDDAVLTAMKRRYGVATYIERVGRARGMNITTDVIVGFPTEDDVAFERTLETVSAIGATKVHVFPYSPRPGTGTADADPVAPAVKRERSRRLRELSQRLAERRWHEKLGTHDTVLVDRPGRGYGADYTPFLLDAPVGSLVNARAESVSAAGIVASWSA